MIGREYRHVFPPKPAPIPAERVPVLEVTGLSWSDRLRDISFSVQAGEVVGLGGPTARSARAAACLVQVLRGVTGELRIDGNKVAVAGPGDAKAPQIGMALIPEDRKTEGLMLPMSVRDNLSFAALQRISRAE